MNGHYVEFFSNGKKFQEGQFHENRRNGKWTVWSRTSTIIAQGIYNDESPESGTFLEYNEAMKVDMLCRYENGKLIKREILAKSPFSP